MLEWKLIRLGDICITNKNSYSSKDNWKFVNYLDTGSLTENKITELQYINIETDKVPSRARRKVIKNSILYSTVRPNQLHYGIIKEPVDNLLVSTGFTVIDVDTNKAIPEFIYYLLTQNNTTEQLQAIAEQSVSTYPSIKSSDIEDLEFKLPNLIIQNRIVSILDTIDSKIRQNEKINNNLEQQAKALFESWFVDYEPFGNTMPCNWEIGKLKEVLKLKRQTIKAGANTELPYLPIDVIPMRTFALTDFKPNSEAQSSLIRFDKDDIIIGAMRVYFHRVIFAPCDGITRTTCFTLTPYIKEYLSFALLCCNQDSSINYAQSTSKGSTMPYAIWDGGLGDMEIVIPSLEAAQEFNKIVLPMLRQIQNSYFENSQLQEIREELFPRLMSGELDVSAIEI